MKNMHPCLMISLLDLFRHLEGVQGTREFYSKQAARKQQKSPYLKSIWFIWAFQQNEEGEQSLPPEKSAVYDKWMIKLSGDDFAIRSLLLAASNNCKYVCSSSEENAWALHMQVQPSLGIDYTMVQWEQWKLSSHNAIVATYWRKTPSGI